MAYTIKVNGTPQSVDVDGDTTLIWVRPAGLCHSADGGVRGSSRHLPADHLPARGRAQYRRTDPGTQRDSQYTRCQAHLRYAAPFLIATSRRGGPSRRDDHGP